MAYPVLRLRESTKLAATTGGPLKPPFGLSGAKVSAPAHQPGKKIRHPDRSAAIGLINRNAKWRDLLFASAERIASFSVCNPEQSEGLAGSGRIAGVIGTGLVFKIAAILPPMAPSVQASTSLPLSLPMARPMPLWQRLSEPANHKTSIRSGSLVPFLSSTNRRSGNRVGEPAKNPRGIPFLGSLRSLTLNPIG
jgi:hypothetical protein